MKSILLYISAGFLISWGIAHLIPTNAVVRGFGDISSDNKKIITMEWIIEGIALIFTGILTGIMAYTDPENIIARTVYFLIILFLVILSVISFITGFRVNFLPYKLCPFIFLISAIMIFIGGIL